MSKNKIIYLLLFILILIFIILIIINNKKQQEEVNKKYDKPTTTILDISENEYNEEYQEKIEMTNIDTFYAKIKEVDNTGKITVIGLDINDNSHNKEYYFYFDDKINFGMQKLTINDFKADQKILICFKENGQLLQNSEIHDVLKVKILDENFKNDYENEDMSGYFSNKLNMLSVFYGRIEEITTFNGYTSLLINGKKLGEYQNVNMNTFREELDVTIQDYTKLQKDGKEIDESYFEEGQIVLISCYGVFALTEPESASEVYRISVVKESVNEKTTSYDDMANSMGSSFYAKIEKVNNTNGISSLEVQEVKSLDSKIESFEGKCLVSIDDNTKLYRNDTEIQISDLKTGQIILISYSGWMSMSDPAKVNEVNKITVIEE